MPADELSDLLARARVGCAESARLLVGRYSDAVRRVVRRCLDQRLRSIFDSTDFVQLVWTDFFADCLRRETFCSADGLVTFLVRMGLNKVQEAKRRHVEAARRTVTRTEPLEEEPPARPPTSEQAVDAADDLHQLLRALPPVWQEALTLLRDGHSQSEVARKLRVSERTVARILERVRHRRAGQAQPHGGRPLGASRPD
jgi:RNA polymerase sigma factor (sigma-70 family)